MSRHRLNATIFHKDRKLFGTPVESIRFENGTSLQTVGIVEVFCVQTLPSNDELSRYWRRRRRFYGIRLACRERVHHHHHHSSDEPTELAPWLCHDDSQLLKCNRTQRNAVYLPPIYGSKRSPPQRPVRHCGTIFHPDCGGRDFPSILSDDLWKHISFATEAPSDSFRLIGAI